MPMLFPSQEVDLIHLQMIRGIELNFVFLVGTNSVAAYGCAWIKTNSIGLSGDDSWIMTWLDWYAYKIIW